MKALTHFKLATALNRLMRNQLLNAIAWILGAFLFTCCTAVIMYILMCIGAMFGPVGFCVGVALGTVLNITLAVMFAKEM